MKRSTETVLREEVSRSEAAVTRAAAKLEKIDAELAAVRADLAAEKAVYAHLEANLDRARAALSAYLGEEKESKE